MSTTDELQEHFDRALASFPPAEIAAPRNLHDRLRNRRRKIRLGAVGSLAILVVVVGLAARPFGNNGSAAAVTLYAKSGPAVAHGQLNADVAIVRDRLSALGNSDAHVSVSGSKILVTGISLSSLSSASSLTASPVLLIRPVLCASGPFDTSSTVDTSLPVGCSEPQYSPQQTTLNLSTDGKNGYTTTNLETDPELAKFPSTSPSDDRANAHQVALLPSVDGSPSRYLVGPTQLALSARVASAHVLHDHSIWSVKIRLDGKEAALWDASAHQYFHLPVAVDLDGRIVETVLIEPTQQAFTSLNGLLQIELPSKSSAQAIAAAFRSGPLPVALVASANSDERK
jgi:hypothetical protein